MTQRRATGKAVRIERGAVEHWGDALGGQKVLAELIGRNPSRINQIKNAGEAPFDLLEELAAEIAKLIGGQRTRLHGRARMPELRFEARPTPEQVFASLTGVLPVAELLRPPWPFIGRARELSQLAAALAGAARGEADRALVFRGAAGVGKTSLLRRAADAAERSGGARAWIGSCPPTPLPVSHGPWIQILHQSARELHAATAVRGRSGLLEELRACDADPVRLYPRIWEHLRALSARSVLLIAIDDLERADAGTQALWSYCAARLAPSEHRILLLGTATLAAQQHAEWELHGLSESETAELVRIRNPGADAAQARDVFRLTRGNPLLIRELAESPAGLASAAEFLRQDGAARTLPGRSREQLERSLRELPEPTLHALEAAAVLGPCFRPHLLSSVGAAPVDLGAALQLQLVQTVDAVPGLYELTPGLLRACIYQRIEPRRLAELHRRAARALRADRCPPASPGELAYHMLRAGGEDSAEGVDWAMKAAEGAYARMAYDEAVLHYRQALAVVDPHGALACRLGVELARAQNRAGHIGAADETLLETALHARTLAEDRIVCAAALELGAQAPYILPSSSEYAGLLEEGIAAAQDRALRAKLMARLAATLAVSDSERAARLAEESIELAHELRETDPPAWVYVHQATYIVRLRPGGAACRATQETACAIADGSKDLDLMLRSRRALVDATMRTARSVDEIERAVQGHAALSERSKQPESRAWDKIFQSSVALLLGHGAEAEALSSEAHEIGTSIGDANAYPIRLGQQLTFWLQRRDWPFIDREQHAPRPPLWRLPGSVVGLCLDAKLGRTEHAWQGLEHMAATGFRELHSSLVWPFALWMLAEALRELRAPQHAATVAEILAGRSEENLVLGLGVAHLGPVSRCLGLLAEARREHARAARLLEHALLQAQQLGAEPWIAVTELDLGRVLLENGRKRDAEHARRLLRTASLRARRLDLPGVVAECRMLGASA